VDSAQDAQAFASIAAQVIPVFLLAIVADPVHRRSESSTAEEKKSIYASGYIGFAFVAAYIGEGVALNGVAQGLGDGDMETISISMGIMALLFALPHFVASLVGSAHSFDRLWLLVLRLILPLIAFAGLMYSAGVGDAPIAFEISVGVLAFVTYVTAAVPAVKDFVNTPDPDQAVSTRVPE
jgi:hypothetical protein